MTISEAQISLSHTEQTPVSPNILLGGHIDYGRVSLVETSGQPAKLTAITASAWSGVASYYLLEIVLAAEIHVRLVVECGAQLAEPTLAAIAPQAVLMPVLVAGLQQELVPLDGLVAAIANVGKTLA